MSLEDEIKWDAKYAAQSTSLFEPAAGLVGIANHLPTTGKVLDVAGGAGRNAIWLAQRGLDVTIADVSSVGLKLAKRRAEQANILLNTISLDTENESLPEGPWDLIICVYYLNRKLFPRFVEILAQGGRLAVIHPTKSNLQRQAKPPERFLLIDGELPTLVDRLKIVHYSEGWSTDDRHEAILLAEK